MQTSFYSADELAVLGLKNYGRNVLISRYAQLYRPEAIGLGDHVRIDDFCVLSGGAGIELGSYIHVAAFCAFYGGAGISIGDFSTTSSRASIYSVSDDYSGVSLTNPTVPDRYKPLYNEGPVTIGRHVVIGANSLVMPHVTVGEGVAVGAYSFVNKDCAPWGIYVGCPAKRIKERQRDLLNLEQQFLADNASHGQR